MTNGIIWSAKMIADFREIEFSGSWEIVIVCFVTFFILFIYLFIHLFVAFLK